MEFFDVIKKRRSVRQFKVDAPVADDHVQKILETAQLAPSAGNTQCTRFFVVRQPELKRRLASDAGHQMFIDQAPLVVVVVADLDAVGESYGERGRSTYALQDTAAAAENILLAATDLGYGACWVGAFDEVRAAKILELPRCMRPVALIPIGVPAEPTMHRPPRRKLKDVATFM